MGHVVAHMTTTHYLLIVVLSEVSINSDIVYQAKVWFRIPVRINILSLIGLENHLQ